MWFLVDYCLVYINNSECNVLGLKVFPNRCKSLLDDREDTVNTFLLLLFHSCGTISQNARL